MARRYTRDNRGRFASSGSGGATARGGRLRTASGKKRETQTMKAQGAGGAGVMKGAVKRDPGAMAKVSKAKQAPKGRQATTFEQATAKSARIKKRAAMVASGEWARAQNRYKAQETGRRAMMVASGNIMAERPRFSTVSNPAPKAKKSRRLSKSERDHRDMLKLAPRMFR